MAFQRISWWKILGLSKIVTAMRSAILVIASGKQSQKTMENHHFQ
jgi:hypothetical protein